MSNQVSDVDKKIRSHKLIEISNELEKEYAKKFIGKKLDVLIEENYGEKSIGHTSNYLRLEIPKILEINQIYEILVTEDIIK